MAIPSAQRRLPLRSHLGLSCASGIGSDGPVWTIAGSRPDHRPPSGAPPPGAYQIARDPVPSRPAHVIATRREVDARTLTSDIDFGALERFPQIRNLTISRSDPVNLGTREPSLEPLFLSPRQGPRGRWSSVRVKIGERLPPRRPEPVPSPWHYDPVYPDMAHPQRAPSLPRSNPRDLMPIDREAPGPGYYAVEEPAKTYTRWTERLMEKSRRWKPPPNPMDRPWQLRK
jgi:hypothetical protein